MRYYVTCKVYNYQVITIIGLLFPRLTTLSSSNDVGFSNRVIFIHCVSMYSEYSHCYVYLYILYYYNFVSFIALLLYIHTFIYHIAKYRIKYRGTTLRIVVSRIIEKKYT